MTRHLLAGVLGTLLLVCTVVGSGIMAAALAGGNDAVALLGNTIATGAILYVLITILGPVSGAHFNPSVSLVFFARGELTASLLALYVVVQCVGGVAGTALAHAMVDMELLVLGTKERTGSGQWLAEGVATFGLVTTILGGLRHRPDAVPMLVGLYITAGYWFTATTSFANPAVTLARSFTESFSGIQPVDMPGFVLAQIFSALAGAALAAWIFPRASSTDIDPLSH